MQDIVEEIIFLQLFAHALISRFEEMSAHNDLKRVSVVDTNQKKTKSYGAEQTTDVG
jgi:hypothetical protein